MKAFHKNQLLSISTVREVIPEVTQQEVWMFPHLLTLYVYVFRQVIFPQYLQIPLLASHIQNCYLQSIEKFWWEHMKYETRKSYI